MVTSRIGSATKDENLEDIGGATTDECQDTQVFVSDLLSSNSNVSFPISQVTQGNWMRRAGVVVERIVARGWWLASGMLSRSM